jgi:hypothetical protein
MPKFIWKVSSRGYAWEGLGARGEGSGFLVPNDRWRWREYHPLEEHSGLFLAFKDTKGSDGILEFANRYGHLGFRVPEPGLPSPDVREELADWHEQIWRMEDAFDDWTALRQGNAGEVELGKLQDLISSHLRQRLEVRFEKDPKAGGMSLEIAPLNLIGALWLQFARAIVGEKQFRKCLTCERWFEVSPEVFRTNRLYCSEGCRSRAYRARRERAVELAAEGKTPKQIADELDSDIKTIKGWLKRGET